MISSKPPEYKRAISLILGLWFPGNCSRWPYQRSANDLPAWFWLNANVSFFTIELHINLSFSSGSKRKSTDVSGGSNPVVVRPTPSWQKSLGDFFKRKPDEDGVDGGNSSEKGWTINVGGRDLEKCGSLPPATCMRELIMLMASGRMKEWLLRWN